MIGFGCRASVNLHMNMTVGVYFGTISLSLSICLLDV
jgi:hypothetical protein